MIVQARTLDILLSKYLFVVCKMLIRTVNQNFNLVFSLNVENRTKTMKTLSLYSRRYTIKRT